MDSNMIEHVLALQELTGCSSAYCKQAIEYVGSNKKLAIAYLKAKSIAVATPRLSFDERVKWFYAH